MPELSEVFEMTTEQIEPDVDAWRDQETRHRNANRNRKIGAFAVAVAIVGAAIVLIVGTWIPRERTMPADEPPVTTPSAVEVARGFVRAFGTFDAERAVSYLADDVDLSGFEATSVREFGPLLSLLEVVGWNQMLTSCERTSTSTLGANVRCAFDFQSLRSDEIGLGPYSGSYFSITVRREHIVRLSLYFDIREFSGELWEPFMRWVVDAYPRDAKRMYKAGGTEFRLTETSIRLWGQHTREYVERVTSGRA